MVEDVPSAQHQEDQQCSTQQQPGAFLQQQPGAFDQEQQQQQPGDDWAQQQQPLDVGLGGADQQQEADASRVLETACLDPLVSTSGREEVVEVPAGDCVEEEAAAPPPTDNGEAIAVEMEVGSPPMYPPPTEGPPLEGDNAQQQDFPGPPPLEDDFQLPGPPPGPPKLRHRWGPVIGPDGLPIPGTAPPPREEPEPSEADKKEERKKKRKSRWEEPETCTAMIAVQPGGAIVTGTFPKELMLTGGLRVRPAGLLPIDKHSSL